MFKNFMKSFKNFIGAVNAAMDEAYNGPFGWNERDEMEKLCMVRAGLR